jgi:hypothetical protein
MRDPGPGLAARATNTAKDNKTEQQSTTKRLTIHSHTQYLLKNLAARALKIARYAPDRASADVFSARRESLMLPLTAGFAALR